MTNENAVFAVFNAITKLCSESPPDSSLAVLLPSQRMALTQAALSATSQPVSANVVFDALAAAKQIAELANECCYRSDGYEEQIEGEAYRALIAAQKATNKE